MAIALTCSQCEHDLKVKEELAGRRIKCPECGQVLAVPESSPRGGAVAAGASAKSRDLDGEEEVRPRKKKKKRKQSNKALLIGLAVGAVLLAIAGVVLIIVLNQGDGDGKGQAKGDPKKLEPAPDPADDFPPPPPPQAKPPATGIRRAAERTEVKNALRQIGLAYHMYCDMSRKGPQKWEDLAPFYEKNIEITNMLKTKYLTFLYGTHLTQMTQGTSNTVLAYETQLDQQGIRIVLMADGSVTFMTDEELKAAPKAGQR
jgi:ribosomal protein S27E